MGAAEAPSGGDASALGYQERARTRSWEQGCQLVTAHRSHEGNGSRIRGGGMRCESVDTLLGKRAIKE